LGNRVCYYALTIERFAILFLAELFVIGILAAFIFYSNLQKEDKVPGASGFIWGAVVGIVTFPMVISILFM
jgi:hypothetical protein